jgi:hypothetical protein
MLQSLIFFIRYGKNPVIYDDPTPLSSFNSIPHFSTFQFSPWSKKNPSNQSRELGQKSFSRLRIPAFTLNIQTGIS